jgi:LCP family protein required for cell wall assembly
MTDELEALRGTRSAVPPPAWTVRRGARARWDHDLQEDATVATPRSHRTRTFTLRTAIAGVTSLAIVAGAWFVTRARIDSVKPSHVVSVGSLAGTAATDPQVFLLVGSDSREFVANAADQQHFGDPSTVTGARSDTMVLVRVDPKSRHTLVVSIPRDRRVAIPGHGTDKINAAFAFGGLPLLVTTISRDLGVPINHVIEVEFPQFASLVDELGGLRIRFPTPARDTYSGLAEPAGCTTLVGHDALAFVRARHYEYLENGQWQTDPTSDLGRMARQQLALRQLAAAAESRLSVDPRPLLRALFADITVDSGFTPDDALRYFAALRRDHVVVSATLPVRSAVHDSQAVLLLQPSAHSLLDQLAGSGTAPQGTGGAAKPAQPPINPTAC